MKRLMLIATAFVAAVECVAAVTMPHVFGDNMVLQQGQPVPVWGKAEPGEKVSVSFAGQTVAATTDAQGKWSLKLAPLRACAEGTEFRVMGDNTLVFKNVVVGEVWFCAGQLRGTEQHGVHHEFTPEGEKLGEGSGCCELATHPTLQCGTQDLQGPA